MTSPRAEFQPGFSGLSSKSQTRVKSGGKCCVEVSAAVQEISGGFLRRDHSARRLLRSQSSSCEVSSLPEASLRFLHREVAIAERHTPYYIITGWQTCFFVQPEGTCVSVVICARWDSERKCNDFYVSEAPGGPRGPGTRPLLTPWFQMKLDVDLSVSCSALLRFILLWQDSVTAHVKGTVWNIFLHLDPVSGPSISQLCQAVCVLMMSLYMFPQILKTP